MLQLDTDQGSDDRFHYLCGPPDMVTALTATLEGIDVPKERIRTEHFTGY